MIIDAAELSVALRDAASAGGRQKLVAAARGGVQRARALAARFPFLDVRVVPIDDDAIARAVAPIVPAGCDGVVVPGEPRLARLIADRAGCRWSAGSAQRLRCHPVLRPWILSGQVLELPAVRALVASRVPHAPLRTAATAARNPATRTADAAAMRLPPLLARMERDLDPTFGQDDGPVATVQPSEGWEGCACADLRSAQRMQRKLVAAGMIVQRQGRILRIPAGAQVPGAGCPPPAAPEPPAPETLFLRRPADAAPGPLLDGITAAMQAGARCMVVQPLAEHLRDREDLVEDLRLIARRCPFLDLHLAEPVCAAERAALLAPQFEGSIRLCGADRGGLAILAERLGDLGIDADPACGETPWDADDWSDPASQQLLAQRRAAALTNRELMPDPWQEVAQALAQGEAHHGGQVGESVAATGLALGPVMVDVRSSPGSEADLASSPISPQAALLVEPVAAAEALLHPARQSEVLATLDRGLRLLTGLPVQVSDTPGWIGIRVPDPAFMLRAVVVQGVLARRHGDVLWLPAGPDFGLRREVRSILTAVATAVVALGEMRAQPPAMSR
jgi:hypothetical protein